MEGSHAATAATEDAPFETKQLLARKLTCSTLSAVFVGGFLIILNKVGLMLIAVPDWGADAKQAKIDLERKNMLKLASDKAEYVTEIFGRVKEGLLQVHAFAGEALAAVPETMVVDEYLMDYPGLEQFEMTWDHSIW